MKTMVVIVMTNFYFGCVIKDSVPHDRFQTKNEAKLKAQELKMEKMKKELEELKKNQNQ